MPYKLTDEGKEYLKKGLPEKSLIKLLEEGPKPLDSLVKTFPKFEIALGWARKNNWAEIKNSTLHLTEFGKFYIKEQSAAEKALDDVYKKSDTKPEFIKMLLNRNLITEFKEGKKESLLEKLFKKKEVKKDITNEIAQLTPDIIKEEEWKRLPFKKYDIQAPAPKVYPGKKQPYVQFIEDIREKLIGLGFQEMRGPLVETFFWNTDALFMPFDHPARGIHDVLLLKNPTKGNLPDENLVAKVKATHEGGWITESSGWGGIWDKEEASKLLMRSQGTAVSARTLFQNKDNPAKYFLIDRVFRHDILDAKHLMEFDHCEGIVVGEGLTFRHLLGFLKEIADAVGVKEVRFKPSYFSFTEPSVELYVNYPKLGWIEAGGAGMFRPEVLKPLGVEKSQVLAWGLGIGRLAMIKLAIEDIRMLYSDNLEWLRELPLVR